MTEMKQIKLNHWICTTGDPATFKIIVDQFNCINPDNIVRKSKNRTIFKINVNGINYYVKINHQTSVPHKVKEAILGLKAHSEFISIQKLQRLGIPVVKTLGWGRYGTKSFLVTEAAEPVYLNARDVWLKCCINNPKLRERFLKSLGCFIGRCLSSNIIHSDFHLGNLLVKELGDKFIFLFVDVYGVRPVLVRRNIYHSGIASILASLVYALSIEEFRLLLLVSGVIKKIDNFERTVLRIKKFAAADANEGWHKKREKILSKESRFSLRYVDSNKNIWYLRKDKFGQPIIGADKLDKLLFGDEYNLTKTSRAKAIKTWINSFYLQFHQVPHIKPIVVYIPREQKEDAIIVSRKYDLARQDIPQLELKELLEHCKLCKIKVLDPKDNIVMINNKAYLKDSNPSKIKPG